jgi:hypothetical protein
MPEPSTPPSSDRQPVASRRPRVGLPQLFYLVALAVVSLEHVPDAGCLAGVVDSPANRQRFQLKSLGKLRKINYTERLI